MIPPPNGILLQIVYSTLLSASISGSFRFLFHTPDRRFVLIRIPLELSAQFSVFFLCGDSCGILFIRIHEMYKILVRSNERLFQITNQFGSRLISSVGRFLTTLQYDFLDTKRNIRYIFAHRWNWLLNVFDGNGNRRISVKGNPSG